MVVVVGGGVKMCHGVGMQLLDVTVVRVPLVQIVQIGIFIIQGNAGVVMSVIPQSTNDAQVQICMKHEFQTVE